MAKDQYVTKEEFSELVEKFNALCEELSAAAIKKPIDFSEMSYDYEEEDDDDEDDEYDYDLGSEKSSGKTKDVL